MSDDNKYTVNEHYISRMYLREFSEIKGVGNKEKAFVWQYNVKTMKQTPVQVNISNICYEKNLYELMDTDGAFIARNTIEKTFGKIESEASDVIRLIKLRSQQAKCINCTKFLSDKEKSLLIFFITTLMFRDPETINTGIRFLKDTHMDISDEAARNFTLLNLLPLGVDLEWDKNTIIRSAITKLCGMAFQVGVASSDVIFTSDRPFVQWLSHNSEFPDRPEAFVFPMTSKLVLHLYPLEKVDKTAWNVLFEMDDKRIQDVQTNISVCAREWIYSRNMLSPQQLKIIKEARSRCD